MGTTPIRMQFAIGPKFVGVHILHYNKKGNPSIYGVKIGIRPKRSCNLNLKKSYGKKLGLRDYFSNFIIFGSNE